MAVEVPALMSLEGRAIMISEEVGRIQHSGDPAARREHVRQHALAHLRAAMAQAREGQAE